jgi:DNA-binding protein HU-beta
MNAIELADHLAEVHTIPKSTAKAMVETVIKTMTDKLVAGEEVSLVGFGKFKTKARPARAGRNPKTGASIQIEASTKLSFSPSSSLKKAISA